MTRHHLCKVVGVVLLCTCAAGTAFAQPPTSGKKYAVVVGINRYEHANLPPLRYAVADAAELGQQLAKVGYDVTALTDDSATSPTKANIERASRSVLDKCRSGDTVIIAFAGHGMQFNNKEDAFFCPVDARPFGDRTESLVSLDQLYRNLDASHAGVQILLVDACRNNPDQALARSGLNADAAPRPPRGVGVLFSCSAGEMAFEHHTLKHGIFFHHIIKGLQGDAKSHALGIVTFASLADYVSTQVSHDVTRLLGNGARQSPNLKADLSGASPVLVRLDTELQRDLQEHVDELKRKGSSRGFYQRRADTRLAAWLNAAEGGDATAQLLSGACYEHGTGLKQDDAKAVEWYKKAANQGNAAAQHNLGFMYRTGRGVDRDDAESVKWYRLAAAQGFAVAQNNLGFMYSEGLGVPRDDTEAVRWYRLAAVQANANAQSNLAFMYANGRGVPQDDLEAVRWYREAADQGFVNAQARLGSHYEAGRGVPKDQTEAIRLYRLAATQGDAWAKTQLKRLHAE
jgi:TPR repeat protein